MKTICAVTITALKNPEDSYKMKNKTNHCNLNAKAIVIMLIIMMLTIILAKANKEKINQDFINRKIFKKQQSFQQSPLRLA